MISLFKPFVAPDAAAHVAEVLASGYLGEGASVRRLLEEHKRVKAIVAVDYGGTLPDLASLRGLADMYGARLIEDCAHSFGAYGHGLAHMECYSFQAIKHLTTGDGGALVTGD